MKKQTPRKGGSCTHPQTITIHKALIETPLVLPYSDQGIKAGFPSPAQDYEEPGIDLNRTLIKHPATTFLAKVKGDCLYQSFIFDGDIAVVDKSLEPREGCKVVAFIDGEFTMKSVKMGKDCVYLIPDNPDFPTITVTPDQQFMIWGVITYTVHKHY